MTIPSQPYGRLFIVGTPIGNPEDITLRALSVLREAAFVAAEDTRRAGWLLARLDIKSPLLSCHRHNEAERVERILDTLRSGRDVAYLTDAGTPGVSDPGFILVRAVAEAGFSVVPIPGPSAVTAALSICGLPGRGFHFLGFLPRGANKRRDELKSLALSPWPLVVLESPRRIHDLISLARDILGDRQATLCRELTKTYEEIFRGPLSRIQEELPQSPKGEITLVISGAGKENLSGSQGPLVHNFKEQAKELLAQGMSRPKAARRLAKQSAGGISRSDAYELLLKIPDPLRFLSIQAQGHPQIKATHAKTVEFKKATELTERETCVLGVGADWDPSLAKKMRGRVEVSLEIKGRPDLADRFEAEISPKFSSGEKMVFRKSHYQCRSTLGNKASKGAENINRDLVEHLKSPDSHVLVRVRPIKET